MSSTRLMSSSPATRDATSIELALVSHTNAGKTTLARTLLAQDVGEVRDAPHVTEVATAHLLIEADDGARLRLWDTPGFGDSTRLVARLRQADNPIGWLLRELWDRHRDRPLWCSQQAVRAAREDADVVLYLVNAAEDPRDAGWLAPELQVLRWIDKPVIALLNQLGPPRSDGDEAIEIGRWRQRLQDSGIVQTVLPMDAFARCWVQERVLLDAVARALPLQRRAVFARLQAAWHRRNEARLIDSAATLADQLADAAADSEAIEAGATGSGQKLMRTLGLDKRDAEREAAMGRLLQRLDAAIRDSTARLIALHGLQGDATQVVLDRLREHFSARERVDEGRSALWSGLLGGALTGLKADLAAGGLTFGAGMLVGGVLGSLAGAGAARGFNALTGRDRDSLRFSPDFLDSLLRSAVLRYLAVAHFGRGRGNYVEGEAPAHWQHQVQACLAPRSQRLHRLWVRLADPAVRQAARKDLRAEVEALLRDLLQVLYPSTAGRMDPP